MYAKILVCSDGSPCALEASRTAALLARHFQSEVLALQVCDPPMNIPTQGGGWSMVVGQDVSEQYLREQAELHDRQMKTLFEQEGVCCRIIEEKGHPVEAIVRIADWENADLIVMGSRGLHGLKEFFLGSVSQGVLHHAPCSVLIVREKHPPQQTGEFQRILLASDGSEGAGTAAVAAAALAEKFATSLTVLNVVEPFPSLPVLHENEPPPLKYDPDMAADLLRQAVQNSVEAAAKPEGVYWTFQQERGIAEEIIVEFAKQHNTDLIVLGSRGLGGFERLLLGSVSNYVTHHAGCSVLVARGA